METLESPSTKTAKFTNSAARRPSEFMEKSNSRITDTATRLERQSYKTIALRLAARLPFTIFGFSGLVCCKAFLRRGLGKG